MKQLCQKMNKNNDIQNLIDHLPVGSKEPISAKALAIKMQISQRELRSLIEKARGQNNPICSSSGLIGKSGYFIAETQEELTAAITFLESYANSFNATIKALKECDFRFV